jgi:predicted PurR-regulated permease PerM
MAIWALVLLVVLMIPLLAIVIDSEFGRALARRISREGPEGAGKLQERISRLEGEVRYLTESLEAVQDETGFLRSLLDEDSDESRALPPGD